VFPLFLLFLREIMKKHVFRSARNDGRTVGFLSSLRYVRNDKSFGKVTLWRGFMAHAISIEHRTAPVDPGLALVIPSR